MTQTELPISVFINVCVWYMDGCVCAAAVPPVAEGSQRRRWTGADRV